MCPTLINVTESTRIDSELRGWFHAPNPAPNRRPSEGRMNPTPPPASIEKPRTQHEIAKVSYKLRIDDTSLTNEPTAHSLDRASSSVFHGHCLQKVPVDGAQRQHAIIGAFTHLQKRNSSLRKPTRTLSFCCILRGHPTEGWYVLRCVFFGWSSSCTCQWT